MEKLITINNRTVRLYIAQVFDEKLGHINEHILAVDVSDIYYESESILELLKIVEKDFPGIKAIYYRMSADNYNTVYISAIGGHTEKHKVTGINTSLEDYEKYRLTLASLHTKY